MVVCREEMRIPCLLKMSIYWESGIIQNREFHVVAAAQFHSWLHLLPGLLLFREACSLKRYQEECMKIGPRNGKSWDVGEEIDSIEFSQEHRTENT